MRGDDGVGALVVQRVRDYPATLADPADLPALFEDVDAVVLVDGALGVAPGVVRSWTVEEALRRLVPHSGMSHMLGLGDALRLCQLLDRLPGYIRIVTIGIEVTLLGQPVSPRVLRSVDRAARTAERLLRCGVHPGSTLV